MYRPSLPRWILPIALAALAPAAAHADAAAEPKVPHEGFTLDNGLRVFVIEDHATPTVAVVTYYRVGSKDERPGKTGFAHLFEHLMFKGSAHAPDGLIDLKIEEAGGAANADTSTDATRYQDLASSAFLEQALYFEADRLAGLTDTIDQAKLDNQRDVVKNERRQSYENQPYGDAGLLIPAALWPAGHGYHWPTIGDHADLTSASLADVKAFFRQYYVPRNAVLVIAGDVDPAKTRALVTRYLGWIPGGELPRRPAYKPPAPITKEIRLESKDDVQLPRVYLAWRGPATFAAGEAELVLAGQLLGDGLSSRLNQRLVYEERLAQDVDAGLEEGELGGTFVIEATPKPGVDPDKIVAIVDEEIAKLAKAGPSEKELTRVQNAHEAHFLRGLEDLVARAERLAAYVVQAGDPDYLGKDVARYRAVTGAQLSQAVAKYLAPNARVRLTIRPQAAAEVQK
jgi:zinc protease